MSIAQSCRWEGYWMAWRWWFKIAVFYHQHHHVLHEYHPKKSFGSLFWGIRIDQNLRQLVCLGSFSIEERKAKTQVFDFKLPRQSSGISLGVAASRENGTFSALASSASSSSSSGLLRAAATGPLPAGQCWFLSSWFPEQLAKAGILLIQA